jgi:5'-nucleotidase / UDP-sugar diphosphatase
MVCLSCLSIQPIILNESLLTCVCSASAVVPNASSPLRNSTGQNIFAPFIIKTLPNGQRIGICGISPKIKIEGSSFPDRGTTVREEVAAATECTQSLTALGINKIILLTHVGLDADVAQIAGIPNVDVIVGGDSHTLLGNSSFRTAGFATQGNYATIVNGVCIVQAWEYARAVGRLDVSFDAAGVVTGCVGSPEIALNTDRYQLVRPGNATFLNTADTAVLTASLLTRGVYTAVAEDANTAAAFLPFLNASRTVAQRVIGNANVSLCHNRGQIAQAPCPNRELQTCLGGGAVCHLVAQGFLASAPMADFAIQNSGGCRTNILQGEVTFAEVFEVLPFANTLTTLRMTGRQIQAVLEESVNNFLNTTIRGSTGSFPFAAGLRWTVDYNQGFPRRFSNIEVNVRLTQGAWTPLDLTRTYTVVTNSFTAAGQDGYLTFSQVSSTAVDLFVEYAQVRQSGFSGVTHFLIFGYLLFPAFLLTSPSSTTFNLALVRCERFPCPNTPPKESHSQISELAMQFLVSLILLLLRLGPARDQVRGHLPPGLRPSLRPLPRPLLRPLLSL